MSEIEGNTLNINFDDVSTEYTQVEPGMYEFEIVDCKTGLSKANNPKVEVRAQLVNCAEEFQGAQLTDHIAIHTELGKKRFKRLAASCGVDISGGSVDVTALIGAVGKFVVTRRTYTDKDTGQVRESTDIKDYVVESSES